MGKLSGKTVLITGATRGIGLAMAQLFAAEGADLAFVYINSVEKAEAMEKELSANGIKAKGYRVDVASYEGAVQMVDEVVKEFGRIDILVALGGGMGIVTDATSIQFRMLNRSKGPAMWSPRAQCDRGQFIWKWREMLDSTENLDIWQDQVEEVLSESIKNTSVTSSSAINCRVVGVKTIWGVDPRLGHH